MLVHLLLAGALGQEPDLPKMNTQLYALPIDAHSTLWTEDAQPAESGTVYVRATVGYLRDPIVYYQGDERVPVLENVLETNLIAGASWHPLRFGIDVPVYLLTTGTASSGGGLGDMAIGVKASLLDGAKAPVGVAVAGRLSAPTATVEGPLSAGWGAQIEAIVDRKIGRLLVATNVGVLGVPHAELINVAIGNQVIVRLGAGYALTDHVGVSGDLAGNFTLGELDNPSARPAEAIAGGWLRISDGLVLRGGAGAGITRGIGAPAARVVLALSFEPAAGQARPEPAAAEPPPTVVRLHVIDTDGQPLAAEGSIGDAAPTAIPGGHCDIPLDPGTYDLHIRAVGYVSSSFPATAVKGEASTYNVVLQRQLVEVGLDRLDLHDRIYFETAKAVIQPVSYPLLDQIASALRDHADILLVRIEGHTDSRGDEAQNQVLSADRASAVRDYLAAKGISTDRMTSIGYGESRPLDTRETPDAWETNRRVEFFIEKRAD